MDAFHGAMEPWIQAGDVIDGSGILVGVVLLSSGVGLLSSGVGRLSSGVA